MFRPRKEPRLYDAQNFVSSLLDYLSRQHSIEAFNNDGYVQTEGHPLYCLTPIHEQHRNITWSPQSNVIVYDFPSTFAEDCQIYEWAVAVDREFETLEL